MQATSTWLTLETQDFCLVARGLQLDINKKITRVTFHWLRPVERDPFFYRQFFFITLLYQNFKLQV